MIGTLSILNVGRGDTKLVFDPDKPEQMAKNAAIVRDMLRRGYALMAKIGPGEDDVRRVTDFDPKVFEYIVKDVPEEVTSAGEEKPKTRRGRTKRVPAAGIDVSGVAPTAGG